jgi:hypothetical protein
VTVINPEPALTMRVEPKVTWTTAASYIATALGLILNSILSGDPSGIIVAELPAWVEALLLPLLPAVIAFLSGYQARHQWRVKPGASGGISGSTEVG